MINFLVIFVIILLTMYAPIELTRVILKDMPFFVASGFPAGKYIFEVWFIWFTYSMGIILLTLWIFKWKIRLKID